MEWNGVAVHALSSIKVWELSQGTSVTSCPHIVIGGGTYSPKCKLSSLLSTEVTLLQTEILNSSSANPSVALQYLEQWFLKHCQRLSSKLDNGQIMFWNLGLLCVGFAHVLFHEIYLRFFSLSTDITFSNVLSSCSRLMEKSPFSKIIF